MKQRADRQGMIYVRRGMARVNTYDLMLFFLEVVQSARIFRCLIAVEALFLFKKEATCQDKNPNLPLGFFLKAYCKKTIRIPENGEERLQPVPSQYRSLHGPLQLWGFN